MGDNNWDLYAVVRGCSPAMDAVSDPFSSFPPPSVLREEPLDGEKSDLFYFPDLMASAVSASDYELEELCKPFYISPQEQLLPVQQQQQQALQPLLTPKPSYPSSTPTAASLFSAIATAGPHQLIQQQQSQLDRPLSQTFRSKRRKRQQKKEVCQIPDGVSSDVWAWRKYGQKPIKGSPYPRGYYRCSSSKGCQARKQVERSRADPGMLLITYTAEHNHPIPIHRNSLAGSTRQKFPQPANSSTQPPSASSPSASGVGDHEELISPRKSSSSPLS